MNAAQARETSTATTADGGVSYAYSCGYATINRTETMLEKAGGRLMDELHTLVGIALAERRREDDAKQQRYIERMRRQTAQAEKARAKASADAIIARAKADEKRAEAEIAKANAKIKELELRERDIALREKQLAKAETEATYATIEKKHKKVDDDGELY